MLNFISSRLKQLWSKFADKGYRDTFVSSHVASNIANQIATLREARGWTQKDLALSAGMLQSRISVLEDPENESVSIATLKRIASAFDVGLAVRFVPFSDIVRWSVDPSERDLCPLKFDEDSLDAKITTRIDRVLAQGQMWTARAASAEERIVLDVDLISAQSGVGTAIGQQNIASVH